MHTDWDNTIVTGISGKKIDMPSDAKVSIFTDNDLMHINDDHFEINLMARLLKQIYIVPVLPLGYDYDNLHANVMDEPLPAHQQVQLLLRLCFHSQHECIFYIYTAM